jgi:hypothetical protein
MTSPSARAQLLWISGKRSGICNPQCEQLLRSDFAIVTKERLKFASEGYRVSNSLVFRGPGMSKGALIDWRTECEAVHREMDQILRSTWLQTAQERQIRRLQYLALIERRDAAARKLLQAK